MNTEKFLENILPGNYFITKSMEVTKVKTSGTLWYTKKFIVLYYYIFLSDNITTLETAKKICEIFDDYINSLPEELRETAAGFFYSSEEVADLRSDKFRLFGAFAGQAQFADDNERMSYYESAKKYYFAFLMESGGQSGVKKWIKDCIFAPDFCYSKIDDIIKEWVEANRDCENSDWMKKYREGKTEAAIRGIRNDYMAFVRNERQILFYYGFFHSKSGGNVDKEFSSLTPIGELALRSNYYELIAIWEHQKLKMLSQPVNIEIQGLRECHIDNTDAFKVNDNPYLTILKALKETGGFSKEVYQYIISRLPEYPEDGIDVSDSFVKRVKDKVKSFDRRRDVNRDDFHKELLKYTLGVRSDLTVDKGNNPLGLCKLNENSLAITDQDRLDRLIEVYSVLCEYKSLKYKDLIRLGENELKKQYDCNARGEEYRINPKIKIEWDIYNIHSDVLILLTAVVLVLEAKNGTRLTKTAVDDFVCGIKALCPNILGILGLSGSAALKKELKKIASVFTDKSYDVYLNEQSEEYEKVVAECVEGSLADLEQKIKEVSGQAPVYEDGVRKRNTQLIRLVKSYDLQRYASDGVLTCECCGKPTFVTAGDESYVEYHHIIPFSGFDGPDHSLNLLALCPMCHRKMHFIKQEFKQALYNDVASNSYDKLSIETRLARLYSEHKLKSYQIEFLLADNAIDEDAYIRILRTA